MRDSWSGQSGAVELVLQAGPTAVRLAEVGDELIHLGRVVGAGREFAHLRQASGSDPVVACVCFGQVVLDESGEDRENGERVELLVRLDQVAPGALVVEAERVGELPRSRRRRAGGSC